MAIAISHSYKQKKIKPRWKLGDNRGFYRQNKMEESIQMSDNGGLFREVHNNKSIHFGHEDWMVETGENESKITRVYK